MVRPHPQGKEADGRSDIFSFGLVLYEMLTGKRAFDGSSAASVIAAILEREAPSFADLAPTALDRVLRLCLAKDAEGRWQSARDLRQALLAAGPGIATPARRRRRWMSAVAAGLLGVGLIALGWMTASLRQLASKERALVLQVNPPAGACIRGMGEVYKARDTRLDRIVAIKISKEQFSELFEREARVVAALNHPHICTLHDVGPNYLVMEYIEGRPLKGPLPLDEVLKYAAQICDALDAAHKKGIIHRDLKPANILVTQSGIKLLDFGLAKQRRAPEGGAATETLDLTKENSFLGTLQYMSPEQLRWFKANKQRAYERIVKSF